MDSNIFNFLYFQNLSNFGIFLISLKEFLGQLNFFFFVVFSLLFNFYILQPSSGVILHLCKDIIWRCSKKVVLAIRVQILNEAACISHSANTPGKSINSTILCPPTD